VQSVGGGCLIVGDKLYLYASGRNATQETTGLAFLRRDGFASMDAASRRARSPLARCGSRAGNLF